MRSRARCVVSPLATESSSSVTSSTTSWRRCCVRLTVAETWQTRPVSLRIVDSHVTARFPGNANILTLDLGKYVEVLEESRGLVPEFVNPKYKVEKGCS